LKEDLAVYKMENEQSTTPEEKLLNQILTEIDKYENNQKKFVEAMKGFFEDSNTDNDTE
jgi:hypothetical protein